MRLKGCLIFLLFSVAAFGQAAYFPLYSFTVSSAGSNAGALLPLPTAIFAVCNYPANAIPCTNYATTYTNASLTATCPSVTPLIQVAGTTCTGVADAQGNAGFWAQSGTYDYTLTVGANSYGPYHVSQTGSASAIFPTPDVRAFGAVGDGQSNATCSITAGLHTLTCAGSPFVPGDALKAIEVETAGSGSCGLNGHCPLVTTIATYNSA